MPVPLSRLKGVSPELAARFKEVGITTTSQLLAVAKTPEGRELLAAQVNIDPELLWGLVKRADLLRLQGVGGVYGELLEEAGVDTVSKLAESAPESVYAKIIKVNVTNRVTQHPPTLTKIRRWVAQAEELPEIVES